MKRKFNTPSSISECPAGFGVYVAMKDGVVNGYFDRPLHLAKHDNHLIAFEHNNHAHLAATKLNFALNHFNMVALTPAQAVKILNTELYPQKPEAIAWVITAHVAGWRDEGVSYRIREIVEADLKDIENGEADRHIIYETLDYEDAVHVRDLLNREFQINRTIARTIADVREVLEGYAHVS